jgi:putative endonuclease
VTGVSKTEMYYVYVLKLQEKGGKGFYIGYTSDLRKRMIEHKSGNTRSTKNREPKLIYYEAYDDKYLALKREKGLKNSGSVNMSLFKRLQLK